MNRVNLLAVLFVALILGLWEVCVRILAVPVFILPPPSSIFAIALIQAPVILPHAVITFTEILLGICMALCTAIPLSIVMFAKPALEKALTPFLVASQAIPVFALAPLLVVWLGYGIASKVFMAWIIIFFPICVSLLEGFKSCDPEFRVLFRLMGASFFKTLVLLYWPWALPRFFAGLKVGVTVATIGAVIGEWVGAQQGLGFLMIQSNARLQVGLVFAAILWLTAMGLAMWWLVGVMERKIIKWK
ncbi:MAG: ABC transporter permease [Desulfobacula sp.]|jgi:putative hydroxymethylpyrimidine transport system permease protein|uniref:ABC transporter permease n=1 Tax=Desulfobacula sp. TaxID=2593537 RepID=UPI001D782E46|nr:ABC transporter permease [Desulfobacula sp.]MBT3485737.1 ABC transporter permease [Desulfobacula sp.]MBT3805158.1 ABC transporter permease [Desulfobacula sp.]MBT4025537.1 ABC transporter permease [Desulfobacula sp.]MBT4198936.1 ABC transporter permease [Desulfobacula sp.]